MKQENKKQIAIDTFRSGMNCAQSVLSAYKEELKLDLTPTLALASGFGGGMGRLQSTCGAVTGSFMVIGICNSQNITDNEIRSELTPTMIQKFNSEFIKRHGTTNCSELINCDLKTKEGQKSFSDQNLGTKVCHKCISDSIDILEEIKSQP